MKKILLLLTFCLFFVGSIAQNHVIENVRITEDRDNVDFNICYPVFKSGPYADTLNKTVFDMFLAINLIDSVSNVNDLPELFKHNATKLYNYGMTKSIDPINYTLFSAWNVFENKYLISMLIDQYVDMGTALPNVACQDINIRKSTGCDFDPYELIKDTAALMDIAADIFCKDRKLPKDALRIKTGLKYNLADLPMSKVCGFSQKGFVLFYSRGEIAPISVPEIIIVIPYGVFKDLLPADFFDDVQSVGDGLKEGTRRVEAITRQHDKGALKANKRPISYNRY